jgi:hypothetical protein
MSADELRQAAETLRGVSSRATPGPWSGKAIRTCFDHGCDDPARPEDGSCYGVEVSSPKQKWFLTGPRHHDLDRADADANLVATMHPGVGLALADWLDASADELDATDYGRALFPAETTALAAARLINGGVA